MFVAGVSGGKALHWPLAIRSIALAATTLKKRSGFIGRISELGNKLGRSGRIMSETQAKIIRANCHFQTPDVYCGRNWKGYAASALGNPYKGADAIERFGRWLWAQIRRRNPAVLAELRKIRQLLQAQGTVSLGCWCHEKYACHTDVIARAVLSPQVIEILELDPASL